MWISIVSVPFQIPSWGFSCQGSSYSLLGIGMKITMNKVSFLMPHLHHNPYLYMYILNWQKFSSVRGGHSIYSNIAL